MARPKKQGLDYFPMPEDLDQDPKIAMVIAEYGPKAEHVLIKLLGYLYKTHGYFLPWNERERLMFAKRVAYLNLGGSSANLINEVVGGLVRWSFFDKGMFDSSQVLTSVDIQATWWEATRKRKDRSVDQSVWLLAGPTATDNSRPIETNHTPETSLIPEQMNNVRLFPPETSLIPEVMPQSKVKESKEEINKEETRNQPGATYWEREKNSFLTNKIFLERLCIARGVGPAAAAALMEWFVQDLELKGDVRSASELQRYFTNWFNKKQAMGEIDKDGNMKGFKPIVKQSNGLSAREEQSQRILGLID